MVSLYEAIREKIGPHFAKGLVNRARNLRDEEEPCNTQQENARLQSGIDFLMEFSIPELEKEALHVVSGPSIARIK